MLLLDKSLGDSSNRALQKVRRLYQANKGGHTGSLDPLATGMLPICLGEATKVAGMMLGADKVYRTTAQLGSTTTTGDAEGEVVATRAVPKLDPAAIEKVLDGFRGHIEQVPPIYSALKQGGEPLYRKARRGEQIDVEPRQVVIGRLELLAAQPDRLDLEVECGSGTYIRSLVADIGESLGCGAHVASLRRLWVAPFREARMLTLEQLERIAESGSLAALDELLLPVDAGLQHLPIMELAESNAKALGFGQKPRVDAAPGLYRGYESGRLLALVVVDESGSMRSQRGFNLPGAV